MYGLVGKSAAAPGKRDELVTILLARLRDMPGNLSYVVANDPSMPDIILVTEVWADRTAHEKSLSLPSVQDAVQKGRPLIAGVGRHGTHCRDGTGWRTWFVDQ